MNYCRVTIPQMQQAQLHSGGGSMPSLQNIDSSPSNPFQQIATPFPGLVSNNNNNINNNNNMM